MAPMVQSALIYNSHSREALIATGQYNMMASVGRSLVYVVAAIIATLMVRPAETEEDAFGGKKNVKHFSGGSIYLSP
ncbi:hypothetical protein MRX96_038316 [Rhipicephalus microplus]